MRGLTPAAWTLFAAILIALGGQFLFACGFGLGGFFWNACPVPVDAAPLAMETLSQPRTRARVDQYPSARSQPATA